MRDCGVHYKSERRWLVRGIAGMETCSQTSAKSAGGRSHTAGHAGEAQVRASSVCGSCHTGGATGEWKREMDGSDSDSGSGSDTWTDRTGGRDGGLCRHARAKAGSTVGEAAGGERCHGHDAFAESPEGSNWDSVAEAQVGCWIRNAEVASATNEMAAISFTWLYRAATVIVTILTVVTGSRGLATVIQESATAANVLIGACEILLGIFAMLISNMELKGKADSFGRRAVGYQKLASSLRVQLVLQPHERTKKTELLQALPERVEHLEAGAEPLPLRYRREAERAKKWFLRVDGTDRRHGGEQRPPVSHSHGGEHQQQQQHKRGVGTDSPAEATTPTTPATTVTVDVGVPPAVGRRAAPPAAAAPRHHYLATQQQPRRHHQPPVKYDRSREREGTLRPILEAIIGQHV